ncbi:hypothetical protein PV341_26750 [Streptomyces sp. PA03-1a]|nr:hypothetical protein [Streptomyces sp. PA03-1a]MDX2811980.1 hypothetical protein [Streptomyces sp. PA03-5A]
MPPTGYKLAFPMLAHDGARVGFRGVSLGGRIVYGALDDAVCGYGRRHRSPARGCDCGFYCLHTAAEAQALTCATDCRDAVVLQVSVLGAYTRYERGTRYARQRVRTVRMGACRCGRAARVFVRDGTGLPGWRALTASCRRCAAGLWVLRPAQFARLAGPWVNVTGEPPGPGAAEEALLEEPLHEELLVEAERLREVLDRFQERLERLDRLEERPPSG